MKIRIQATETVEYDQIIEVSEEEGKRLIDGYTSNKVKDEEYSDYIDRKDVIDSSGFEVTSLEKYHD